ncbi:tetratricopeptide repeat protein [candidate division WOR-3 bacterium]|nr:tetratricopeptide repeat protein [candidate division WOR-3 bacterium]
MIKHKTKIAALLGLTLLLAGCKSKVEDPYSSYTPEIRNKLKKADGLFYDARFDEAQKAYSEILEADENCVDARIGLGRALRYQGDMEAAAQEFAKAYEADSEHARACLYYGSSLIPWYGMAPADKPEAELVNEAIELMEKALAKDAMLFDAHTMLWPAYLFIGEVEKAENQLKAMVEKGYFPKAVLDYGYNLLADADEGAILFTNGDMDTYPLIALQLSKGTRTDVKVVNLALLNLGWYAAFVKNRLGVPISLTDDELKILQPKQSDEGVKLISDILIDDIIENAGDVSVFFAMVPEDRISMHCKCFSRGGLLTKLEREPVEKPFDREKAVKNMDEIYRLDLPEKIIVWTFNPSPLTKHYEILFVNYGVIYLRIAEDFAEEGLIEDAVAYLKKAAELFDTYEFTDFLGKTLELWQKIKPDDPEAKGYKKALGT